MSQAPLMPSLPRRVSVSADRVLATVAQPTRAGDQPAPSPSAAPYVPLRLATPRSTPARLRVVVAGGGVAGLETLFALKALAGRRVDLTLVAPHDAFVHRPRGAGPRFGAGGARIVPLADAVREAGATFVPGTIEAVDVPQRTARNGCSGPLTYDALVLAVGARAVPMVPHAVTWDARTGTDVLANLLADVERRRSARLAVVVPPGPGWRLRAYQLTVFLAWHVRSLALELETTIVAPPAPLAALGGHLADLASEQLVAAGVNVIPAAGAEVEPGDPFAVILHSPTRSHNVACTTELPRLDASRLTGVPAVTDGFIEADSVLALPGAHGRTIAGVPADANGLIEVDEHGRADGLDAVWAAGDATAFPVKSGAVSVAQARTVAADIAASCGSSVQCPPVDATSVEELAGLPRKSLLEAWLSRPLPASPGLAPV